MAVLVSATALSIAAARSPGLLYRAVDVVRSWTAGAALWLTRRPFGTGQAIDDRNPANEVLGWHANQCFLFDGGRQLQREAEAITDVREALRSGHRRQLLHFLLTPVHEVALLVGRVLWQTSDANGALAEVRPRRLTAAGAKDGRYGVGMDVGQ